LQRQKLGRSHVYLAGDPETAAWQRQAMDKPDSPAVRLPAEIEVLILAEFIKHPRKSFKQLAQTISRRNNLTVEVRQIDRLFEEHGLKKTVLTKQPRP
jgi:hypothetical protein